MKCDHCSQNLGDLIEVKIAVQTGPEDYEDDLAGWGVKTMSVCGVCVATQRYKGDSQ